MPRKAYRLKRNGVVVRTHQVIGMTPQGRTTRLTRGRIGHAGEVYETLAQSTIDQIEAGDLNDTWEIIELPDEDDQSVEETFESPELVQSEKSDPDRHAHGDVVHSHEMEFARVPHRRLMDLAAEHAIEVEGTGGGGSVTKSDVVEALSVAHQEPDSAG